MAVRTVMESQGSGREAYTRGAEVCSYLDYRGLRCGRPLCGGRLAKTNTFDEKAVPPIDASAVIAAGQYRDPNGLAPPLRITRYVNDWGRPQYNSACREK